MKTVKLNDKGIKTLAGAFDAIGTAKEAALKFLKGSEVALPDMEKKLTEVIKKIEAERLAAALRKAREHIGPVEDVIKSLSTQPEKAAEIPVNSKSGIVNSFQKAKEGTSDPDSLAEPSTPTREAEAAKFTDPVGRSITANTTGAARVAAGIDNSDIPTWVRAPLLLLLACAAVW
ncbi:hypothetical protein DQ04_24311000 [Trypanosoma grayi]|uniref:hypothetical protein n=1 Tax=Trypanosoma grayi TaxID=71804 RepID=UPI0004F3F112|nr:hypothetical protein DQ04_24311000 [Trypanosoma grayi]KEG05270.1 hypothetical protein DQ04_24311000 [Trypanosoma grayi]